MSIGKSLLISTSETPEFNAFGIAHRSLPHDFRKRELGACLDALNQGAGGSGTVNPRASASRRPRRRLSLCASLS